MDDNTYVNDAAYKYWKFYRDYSAEFTCKGCSKDQETCNQCSVKSNEQELFGNIPEEIRKQIENK